MEPDPAYECESIILWKDFFNGELNLLQIITLRTKMEENDENSGWTKPKQSYRLKRTISRKRPVLDQQQQVNRTLPERSQPVKRKQPCDDGSVNSPSQASILAAKKQKLGEIFSPSSNFLQSRTLPTNLLQRRLEFNSSLDPRGELWNTT